MRISISKLYGFCIGFGPVKLWKTTFVKDSYLIFAFVMFVCVELISWLLKKTSYGSNEKCHMYNNYQEHK